MSSNRKQSRRSFLKKTAAVTASATFYSGNAYGALWPSERMNIGLIGSGGRGQYLVAEAARQGQRIAALCDVADFRMNSTVKYLADRAKYTETPVFYKDHKELLQHKDLDAVIIGSPDHWHLEHLVDSVEAKKDVYIEKPLSRTFEEGKRMIEAVRKSGRIVQVGNQRHSGDHWARCRDYINSPDFGNLVWVKVWDCRDWGKRDPFTPPDNTKELTKSLDWKKFLGSAPSRDFDAFRYFAWRWYWDYAGGLMTDIGAHQLDVVQWLSGHEKGPKSVVANGGNYHFKHWETPDVLHGVWDYGSFAATFAVEFVNGYDGVGCTFYGTKQTLFADAEKEVRVYNSVSQPKGNEQPIAQWPVKYEGPAHMKNWLECCKSRKDPNSKIELGHQVITAAHLGNMAYRSGKRIYFNPDKGEIVQN